MSTQTEAISPSEDPERNTKASSSTSAVKIEDSISPLIPIENDPIIKSYRSIIDVINSTSNSFKEGKKWKCAAYSYSSISNTSKSHSLKRHKHRRKGRMSHSKTIGEEPTTSFDMDLLSPGTDMEWPGNVDVHGSGRAKKLVRQKAHLDDANGDENLQLLAAASQVVAEVINERPVKGGSHHLRVQRGLPSRQWTVDTCTGLKTSIQETVIGSNTSPSTSSTAYLLRPVSRSSLMSNSGANNNTNNQGDDPPSTTSSQHQFKRLSPAPTSDMARSIFVRSPVREKIRLEEMSRSAGCSFDYGSEDRHRNKQLDNKTSIVHNIQHPSRHRLIKQRTSESAPTAQPARVLGGSSRCLPHQHSNASALSAAAMPTSYSHQGITLVRGASCSLVDIPTYLGPSLAATGGVELAQMCDMDSAICKTVPMGTPGQEQQQQQRKPVRPRLQLDLTKKKNTKNNTRKTQWTVLCVSLTLLTLSVTLVGTMLSIGSQYQERVIAKQWETFTKNQSRTGKITTEEPFIIVPDDIDLLDGEDVYDDNAASGNQTVSDNMVELNVEESAEIVPIIFPPIPDAKDLLGIS